MNRKVLILANDFATIYNFRKELVIELVKNFKVYISFPHDERNEYFKNLGCNIVESKISRHSMNPLKELLLIKDYMRDIKEISPDIVLTYTIKPNIYGGIVCRIKKIPYIANVTGLGSMLQKKGLKRTFLNALLGTGLKKARMIYFQNEDNQDYFIRNRIVKKNYAVLPGSGVNIREFEYSIFPNSQVISFVTVSRIRQDKGYTELLEVITEAQGKYSNVEFHIVGWIEDNSYLNKIKELQSKNKLVFHGKLSHEGVKIVLAKSHCIIHPSYHEGMSNVLLEAASVGRPILASNIPGCRETFDERITGFGFSPRSSADLLKSIDKFMSLTYEEKESMGKQGRIKMVNEFDRTKIVNTYINEINKNIEENENGPVSKNSK